MQLTQQAPPNAEMRGACTNGHHLFKLLTHGTHPVIILSDDYPSPCGHCGREPGSSEWKHRFHHLVKEGANIAVPESTRLVRVKIVDMQCVGIYANYPQYLNSHLQIVDISWGIQTRVQHLTSFKMTNIIPLADFSQLPFILVNQHQFQVNFNFIQDSACHQEARLPVHHASTPPATQWDEEPAKRA